MPLSIEIKAYCTDPVRIRNYLLNQKAKFIGTDFQRDTYFNVNNGRLKLREGKIENALIFYERDNQPGPKPSSIMLYKPGNNQVLRELLERASGIKVVVEKNREIYFLGNVKFHIDEVNRLGNFVEIEAIDQDGSIDREILQQQCEFYQAQLGILEKDLIKHSYSDLLLNEI
mgnify:CR=1 FL=1